MSGTNVLEMELRQQNLEKEVSVLKDTVWKLTGRIYVLEAFISEKFDEVIVDFGMKLSLSSGGQSNFLNNAMQASLIVTKSQEINTSSMNNENGATSPPVGTTHRNVEGNEKGHQTFQPGVPPAFKNPIGSITRAQHHPQESPGLGNGNRNAIPNRILCKAGTSRLTGGDHDNYHPQSDFHVEEFVVFPHVPEFILGAEVQNGSAEMLMAASGSSTEESEDPNGSMRRNLESTGGRPRSKNPRKKRQYKCVPCSKFFLSEWHLKAHLIKHSDDGLISGQQQQQAPQVKAELVTIQETQIMQTGGDQAHDSPEDPEVHKPFPCVYCGKRFRKRQELTVHLRIHTGEKPYKCPMCDRGFSQSSSMKTHLRIHTGEKKIKCDFCKSCFTVTHNYKKHLKTCHQIEDFPKGESQTQFL